MPPSNAPPPHTHTHPAVRMSECATRAGHSQPARLNSRNATCAVTEAAEAGSCRQAQAAARTLYLCGGRGTRDCSGAKRVCVATACASPCRPWRPPGLRSDRQKTPAWCVDRFTPPSASSIYLARPQECTRPPHHYTVSTLSHCTTHTSHAHFRTVYRQNRNRRVPCTDFNRQTHTVFSTNRL